MVLWGAGGREMNRRQFFGVPIGVAAGVIQLPRALGALTPRTPDPSTFQSGDFVWPKKPGTFVPYNSGAQHDPDQDRKKWSLEREAAIRRAPSVHELAALSYDEFRSRYLRGHKPGDFQSFGTGNAASVGHVGLIDVEPNGDAYVIEALYEDGIVRHPYRQWLTSRPGEIVWHGRLADAGPAKRALIASEAKKHVRQPYDFWNFDLNSDAGFYCSKLVWLSVFRRLQLAIDGNLNPLRSFWLSPKQILYSPKVKRLHDPGAYSFE
jgi:hypothetical protein